MPLSNEDRFVQSETNLQSANDFVAVPGLSVYRFDSDNTTKVPWMIRTGEQTCGLPLERKRFRTVELHGSGQGTARVRVYIDRRYICDGKVSFTEAPGQVRKVNLPTARATGYAIDVEIAGTGNVRGMEFSFDVVGES